MKCWNPARIAQIERVLAKLSGDIDISTLVPSVGSVGDVKSDMRTDISEDEVAAGVASEEGRMSRRPWRRRSNVSS